MYSDKTSSWSPPAPSGVSRGGTRLSGRYIRHQMITEVNGLGLFHFAAALANNATCITGTALIIHKLHHFFFPDLVQSLCRIVALLRSHKLCQLLTVRCATRQFHQ